MAKRIRYNYYVLMEIKTAYSVGHMIHVVDCGKTTLSKAAIEKMCPSYTVFFVSFETYKIFNDFLHEAL